MSKVSQITEYVEGVFDLYGINKYEFFFTYDEDTLEQIEKPLFPYDEIDEITLNRISIALGLNAKEILNMDHKAVKKYWDKYPFFSLYKEYEHCWNLSYFKNNNHNQAKLFINAIFKENGEIHNGLERLYDYSSVKKRMIAKLKEIDMFMPGTYHENADITNLEISTEVFFSFSKCTEMIRSFLDMVDRTEELFFKAIKTELCEGEINELNFLATWLNACDVVSPSTLITYDNICVYRDVYAEEKLDDFFLYVKIKRFVETYPWRCQEFFEDMDLVQKFVNIFPQAKAKMSKFAMNVSNFSCTFIWSDAQPVMLTPEEEQELSEFNMILGEKDVPIEEREKEKTHIYVEKSPEEMFEQKFFIKRLNDAISPAKIGGLKIPTREIYPIPFSENIARMQKRVEAKNGGNQ